MSHVKQGLSDFRLFVEARSTIQRCYGQEERKIRSPFPRQLGGRMKLPHASEFFSSRDILGAPDARGPRVYINFPLFHFATPAACQPKATESH